MHTDLSVSLLLEICETLKKWTLLDDCNGCYGDFEHKNMKPAITWTHNFQIMFEETFTVTNSTQGEAILILLKMQGKTVCKSLTI